MVGCLVRLQEAKGSLAHAEERVRSYVLDTPQTAAYMTISELAEQCATSRTTVVRLCRSLGYAGYKDFSKALLRDTSTDAMDAMYADIHQKDDIFQIASSVSRNNIASIQHSLDMMDLNALKAAVAAIIAAKRLHFYGLGDSALVARDAQYKFLRIFRNCSAFINPQEQRFAAASLETGDVAVLISYTGQTPDMLQTLKMLEQTGATLIGITRYGHNPISDAAHISLTISSAETSLRSGATGSRIAQFNMIDILYTAVSSQTYAFIKERQALAPEDSLLMDEPEGLI